MITLGAKLVIGSLGGLTLAGLLGAGLANYTESGAFAFYKQPRMPAWAPVVADAGTPPPETTYPGSYGLYTVTPRSQVDDVYPVRDMVVFDPDPVEPASAPVTEAAPPQPAVEQPREPTAPAEAEQPLTGEPWVTAGEEPPAPETPAEPVSAIY